MQFLLGGPQILIISYIQPGDIWKSRYLCKQWYNSLKQRITWSQVKQCCVWIGSRGWLEPDPCPPFPVPSVELVFRDEWKQYVDERLLALLRGAKHLSVRTQTAKIHTFYSPNRAILLNMFEGLQVESLGLDLGHGDGLHSLLLEQIKVKYHISADHSYSKSCNSPSVSIRGEEYWSYPTVTNPYWRIVSVCYQLTLQDMELDVLTFYRHEPKLAECTAKQIICYGHTSTELRGLNNTVIVYKDEMKDLEFVSFTDGVHIIGKPDKRFDFEKWIIKEPVTLWSTKPFSRRYKRRVRQSCPNAILNFKPIQQNSSCCTSPHTIYI